MYNAYQSQKAKSHQHHLQTQYKKQQQWYHNHKLEQPALVQRFKRRVNGFAKKMEDQPVVVWDGSGGVDDGRDGKDGRDGAGVGRFCGGVWRLRDQGDWRSVLTAMERLERQSLLKKHKLSISSPTTKTHPLKPTKNLTINPTQFDSNPINTRTRTRTHTQPHTQTNSKLQFPPTSTSPTTPTTPIPLQLLFRSMLSQSKYTENRTEFRSRSKDKEINPPMKYTNKNSEFVLASLLPKINKKHRYNTEISHKNDKFSLANSSDPDRQIPQTLSYAQIDLSTLQQSQILRKGDPNPPKTQLQLLEQQQMKALAQKKLYFKSLIEMEQNVGHGREKVGLRDVLVRCGVFRKGLGRKRGEQEEIDRFMEMMKTRY